MSTVAEIEHAILQLQPEKLAELRAWFDDLDARRWDEQFERDVKSGKLDAIAEEALRDLREGRCTEL